MRRRQIPPPKHSVLHACLVAGVFLFVGLQSFGDTWLGEIATSFRAYTFLPLFVLAVFSCLKRKWWHLAAVASITIVNLSPMLNLFQKGIEVGQGEDLKVVQVNVEYCNRKFDVLLKWLKQVDPDVIAVEELSHEWDVALRKQFPNHSAFTIPKENYYGIGIYSKKQLQDARAFVPPGVKPVEPAILARVPCKGGLLNLASVHVFAPHLPDDFRRRNMQMRSIAEEVGSHTSSTVLLGDLNSVPWSNEMVRFKKVTNLRDSRIGFGLVNTCLVKHLFWVPIDYCLVSPGIRVQKLTTGPSFGSDHLPVLLELRI